MFQTNPHTSYIYAVFCLHYLLETLMTAYPFVYQREEDNAMLTALLNMGPDWFIPFLTCYVDRFP